MNRLKTLALAICLSLVATVATAEGRIGISASFVSFDGEGRETLRESGNVTKVSHSEDVVVPSIFVEVMGSEGFGFGVDYVPVAELGDGIGADDDDAETSGTNKVSAELASHVTLYAIKEASNGIYGKVGVALADIDTTENLSTGDTYGNTSTEGVMIAVGKNLMQGNFFVRGEVSYTNYSEVNLNSTGGSTVQADFDAMAATLSVGKSF